MAAYVGSTSPPTNSSSSEVQPLPKGKPRPSSDGLPERYHSLGFKTDLKTGRWMLVPCELLPPRAGRERLRPLTL